MHAAAPDLLREDDASGAGQVGHPGAGIQIDAVRQDRDTGRYFAQLRYSLIALGLIGLAGGVLLVLDQIQTDRQRQTMVRQEAVESTLQSGRGSGLDYKVSAVWSRAAEGQALIYKVSAVWRMCRNSLGWTPCRLGKGRGSINNPN
jgi:hypothetical protein